MRLAVTCIAMLAMSQYSCTDVTLCAAPCTEPVYVPPDNVVNLEGTACTVEPNAVIFPYKVLFVIDVSGSNRDSDPNDNRAAAVQRVLDQYLENRAVSFGFISFSTEAEKLTEGFTRNRGLLVPSVVNSLKRKDGGTNYTDTLDLVREFIERDAQNTPEAELARTRYDIQWLSDGVPDPCVYPAPIVEMTRELLALRDQYGFFDMRLNTTRLFFPGYPVAGCEQFTPTDYLEPMAEAGDGVFKNLTSAQLAFDINFTEIYRRFEQRDFYVVNMSRVVSDDTLLADSDTDGIPDVAETRDFDPTLADSNADGCSDRVDQELMPNVGLCSSYCAEAMSADGPSSLVDRDHDTLPDCAEQTLGYHRLSSDSDRDGFQDDLELKLGTNPLDARTLTQDSDRDGMSDAMEIRIGTNPLEPDANDEFMYRYSPLDPIPTAVPGTSCFDFRVENVRLVHTRATPTTREGDNVICLFVSQTSVDDPESAPTITRACVTARYRVLDDGSDVKDPSDGEVVIDAYDFGLAYQSD